jgi:CelD/BcsL family acetyltransferase involved in cellulose biosynthesis
VQILPLAACDPAAYADFLRGQAAALVYHTPGWLQVLEAAYGYRDRSLAVIGEGGELRGVLPLMHVSTPLKGRRLVSLPFSHSVPLLADSPEAEAALLQAAWQLTRQENYPYLQLRARAFVDTPPPDLQAVSQNYISELDLRPGPAALLAKFASSRRRNLRQAEAAGFELRRGNSPDFAQAFYDLEVTTRQAQGAPVYPARFFPLLCQHLGPQTSILLLSYGGEVVAGLVLLKFGRTCIYGYGGSRRDRDEELRKLQPMAWLMWQAIQEACAEGYQVFDFGTTPRHHTSLLDFKNRYNPLTTELSYGYFLHTRRNLPLIQRDSRAMNWLGEALRRLPRPLFARLTPYLLREVS